MNRELFLLHLNKGDLGIYKWYVDMFSIPLGQGVYITSKDGGYLFEDGTEIVLSDVRLTPLLLSDRIPLQAGDMAGITDAGSYLLGDIILNYLMSVYPFKNPLPFNENLTHLMVEDHIAYNLDRGVTSEEYGKFIEGCDLLEQLSDLFVTSSTMKSISPAPGMKEYKTKLVKEYSEKYGDKFHTDVRLIVEIEGKLEAYDREYMKDDPTYGVLSDNKIMGNARKNMFSIVGAEMDMNNNMTPIITEALIEGYPKDKAKLASLYNSARKGSIMRGYMTQHTGADANTTMRVVNAVLVSIPDCGTKRSLVFKLTDAIKDEYVGHYILEGGKTVLLTRENIDSYSGKVIHLRSYMYCESEVGTYCGKCAGTLGEDNKNIAVNLSTEISAIFTNGSMKAIHDKTVKLVSYDLAKALSIT